MFGRSFPIRRWLPVFVWMAVIFAGSTELGASNRTSRFIAPIVRWFNPNVSAQTIRRVQLIVRKCAHVTEYAVLAVLLWRAQRGGVPANGRTWAWDAAALAVCLAAVYAALDEFHQSLVPSREASFEDVLIDACGAFVGLALLWLIGHLRRRW